MLTAVVDGDMVAFLAALSGDRAGASAVGMVRRYMTDLRANRAIVCFSDPSRRYWRHELFAAYEQGRKPHPPEFAAAVEALSVDFMTRTIGGLEADDLMGILATHSSIAGDVVLVAADKDLRTVPGHHYNPRKPFCIVDVTEHEADRLHMLATLTGDTSDGYGGCPGVGPERASKAIWGEPELWWGQVVATFRSKQLTADDALLQARLSRICRASDFNFETQTVIPWNPTAWVEERATR